MTENLEYYRRRGFTETQRATSDGLGGVHFARYLDAAPGT